MIALCVALWHWLAGHYDQFMEDIFDDDDGR
jgi:hypothetical protein